MDVAHFTTVHHAKSGGEVRDLSLVWPLASWVSISAGDIGGKPSIAQARIILDGLGLHKVEVNVDDGRMQFRSFLYVTPVDSETVVIRMTVSIKETGDQRKDTMLVKYLIPRLASELVKDFDIWEHKQKTASVKVRADQKFPVQLFLRLAGTATHRPFNMRAC